MTGLDAIPSLDRYESHLAATAGWLLRSLAPDGGSRAFATALGTWSRPYPETTGYIIPTLLDLDAAYPDLRLGAAAHRAGAWLLSIQREDGAWHGGLHPPRGAPSPSVFNTGQILIGLCALADRSLEPRWLEAAGRGAAWLADRLTEDGVWPALDYGASVTPSYYTHVAWPMLEVWNRTGDEHVKAKALRFLDVVLGRQERDGFFARAGFGDEGAAFTHTIAYTLCGLIEASRLLDRWEPYGASAARALEVLARKAELSGGSLPGAFGAGWKPAGRYVCLTGNAQLAILLMQWEEREHDLRLVNAAAKLVDRVCSSQSLHHPVGSLAGAVAGSSPLWGNYMRFRSPNWAAKYHADALARLRARLLRER
jgi:hypothetical protein